MRTTNRLGHPRVGLVEAPEAVDTTRHEPRGTAQQRCGAGERALVAQTRPVLRSMPHYVHVDIIAPRYVGSVFERTCRFDQFSTLSPLKRAKS